MNNDEKKDDLHPAVRKFLGKIGAKGGKAGKGTERRRELNRRAAQIRWQAYRRNSELKQS
jgi:hypothetical protein